MKPPNQKSQITNQKSKAVFLDRDGTMIEEVNFLSRLEDLRIFPYTNEALRLFRENNFRVLVVTNQSGIGRNFFSEQAMHDIHDKMLLELNDQIESFYFCPHLPNDRCACRKPNLGMIEAANADGSIDLSNSWMIGDKLIDIETGFNALTKTVLVLTGYGQKTQTQLQRQPDLIAENLLIAAQQIIEIVKN